MRVCLMMACCLWAGSVRLAYAQTTPTNDMPRTCATMEQDSINRRRFPELGTLDDFEYAIQRKIREIRLKENTGRTKAEVITIPIIVHVIHNGEPKGSGLNLSQEQIQAQIEVLNEDFRKMLGTPGYNTNPAGADIEIEFCLSPVDEDGKTMAEPGIDRYDGNRSDWSRDQIENQLKPATIWNPNLFYNIWTLKFAASDANLLGYAQFPEQTGLPGLPTSGPAATDGVVVRYTSFGSADKGNFPIMQAPYNKGRTLTHETGHWLGLRHIWGDGRCADDFVADTPSADGPNTGCPVGRISCGVTNMVQNYMDYTNDACMNIFTQGQKTRMRAAIEISPRRKAVMTANLCTPVVADKPTADFRADKLQCVLLGSAVSFTDLSTNFPSTWQWVFEGGDPNTSTLRNPKVKYNTTGVFNVRLIVKNSLGADTLTLEDYINVSEEGICSELSNFKPEYTPSVLALSDFGNYTGYLTGHNSVKSKAFTEFFKNSCGYKYVSGVKIRFDEVDVTSEDAKVTVTVWRALGPQDGPAPVLERKEVLLKQIQEDIANNRPTTVIFDRETPVSSFPFHVGVEITYDDNYTLAIRSSANGEATDATSWVQDASGQWNLFTIAFGANIVMDIQPVVGANPSVQVSASKLLVYPGEEVSLNGRGASIFVWSADDGSVQNIPGPQLTVRPTETTTYITTGSGLELCNTTAYTTIYIREDVTGTEDDPFISGISLSPNPGSGKLNVMIDNLYRGNIGIQLYTVVGTSAAATVVQKTEDKLLQTFDTASIPPGVYLIQLRFDERTVIKKWVKH